MEGGHIFTLGSRIIAEKKLSPESTPCLVERKDTKGAKNKNRNDINKKNNNNKEYRPRIHMMPFKGGND